MIGNVSEVIELSDPAKLGKHQVYGVGPELTFTIVRKQKPVAFVNMRYLVEFGAESTTEGDTFTLALTIPLGG